MPKRRKKSHDRYEESSSHQRDKRRKRHHHHESHTPGKRPSAQKASTSSTSSPSDDTSRNQGVSSERLLSELPDRNDGRETVTGRYHDTSSSDEDKDEFGQEVPPLKVYLRGVLDKYPDGGQILKELLQNADDAGAKNVIFMYDKTEYDFDDPDLAPLQGPALYAYNDSTFTDKDWNNIQHPNQSGKKDEPTKVGRFGLGFISVYHLTDLPSILSGNYLRIFDPHQKFFGRNMKGKSWKITSEKSSPPSRQLSPFVESIFNSDGKSFGKRNYPSTIFRFPLRRIASDLSKTLYTGERVRTLFHSFEADAEISLLFLKNVESLSLYEKNGLGKKPKLRFRARIADKYTQMVRLERKRFLEECTLIRPSNIPIRLDFVIERHSASSAKLRRRFLLSGFLKRNDISEELQLLTEDESLKFLPWVSVAVAIDDTDDEDDIEDVEGGVDRGRTFCFLPLPPSEKPGLPVHVHGYFGLNDNRRGIKWPDDDSARDNQAKWNTHLAAEVFPDAYARLILQAIDTEGISPEQVYRCWPTENHIQEQWHDGIDAFVKSLANKEILYTEASGGKWMAPQDIVLNTERNDLLQKLLLRHNEPVVILPRHIQKILKKRNVPMQEITPGLIRTLIKKDTLDWLSDEDKLNILEYILSDNRVDDLTDIPLLPLLDGTYTTFSSSSEASTVYIPTANMPANITPASAGTFASPKLPKLLKSLRAQQFTQLKILDPRHLVRLLQISLPNTWTNLENAWPSAIVTWYHNKDGEPSYEWLLRLWTWLRKNYKEYPLKQLEGISLLPLDAEHGSNTPIRLARLQHDTLIFQKHGADDKHERQGTGIPEEICCFLKSLGAVVVNTLPECIQDHPHIGSFILPPTPEGVAGMLAVRRKQISYHIDTLEDTSKDVLRKYLSQMGSQAIQSKRGIICTLPIFPVTGDDDDDNYASINMCHKMIPSDFHGIPVKRFTETFICLDEMHSSLVSELDVELVSQTELLEEYIFPDISSQEYDKEEVLTIMTWVISRSQYDDKIADLKFIPNKQDIMMSPEELFDPEGSNLVTMLGESPDFPNADYAKGMPLKWIQRIGLRQESDVTADEILKVAIEIQTYPPTTSRTERAKSLVKHLSQYPDCLKKKLSRRHSTKTLANCLEDIAWVPVGGSRPQSHLYPKEIPWFGQEDVVYKPGEVASISNASLWGSVKALIDPDAKLLDVFKWNQVPDHNNDQHIDQVVCHLHNVVSNYSGDTENGVYFKMITAIYEFLDKVDIQRVNDVFHQMNMAQVPWVWHGDGFTTIENIALDKGALRVSLAPYLYILPQSLARFKQFLAVRGVNEHFPEDSLSQVLLKVRAKNNEGKRSTKEIDQDVGLVCDILNCIAVMLPPGQQPSEDIVVPTRTRGDRLCLVKPQECLYVDEERLKKEYDETGCELPIIHHAVPTETAQRLGLLKLSHYVAPAERLDIGYDIEGPHETTVNAIRRNLEMYKDGLDVFKELIQNADDAQATEIKFLVDWRTNKGSRCTLFDEAMGACHGPALWAFNNARFSEEDVKNICNIAAATKKRELDKVGRFGLGFTSVYHITDVPSIVSGPFVLIFDPRTTHLRERITAQAPGLKLDLRKESNQKTLQSYTDQFLPFQGLFNCDIINKQYYDHTIFRFPLRTEQEAKNRAGEVLSDKVYNSHDDMDKLVENLKSSASSLLLFTQNIETVTIGVLEEKELPNAAKEIFSVSVKKLQQIGCTLDGSDGDLRSERNLLKRAAVLLAEEQPRSSNTDAESDMVTSMIIEVAICESRKLKRNTKKSSTPITKTFKYLVSSCISRGEALKMSTSDEGRRFGVVPCGGVAALLARSTPKAINGQAFCFLPLDVGTGFPFHINGTFLLQPNRRQLWTKTTEKEEEEFEVTWNECLMRTALLTALMNLFKVLRNCHNDGVIDASSFQRLWPRLQSTKNGLGPLVHAFYRALGRTQDQPAIIHNGAHWISLENVVFTTADIPNKVKDTVVPLLNQHSHPKRYVEFDADVFDSLKSSGSLERFDENTYDWEKFISIVFFPMLDSQEEEEEQLISSEHRDAIVIQLLDDRIGALKRRTFDERLRRTQCIPVCADGQIRSPMELVDPNSEIGKLFRNEDKKFPYGVEYNETRLFSLSGVGMATDDLSWDDVCQRAEFIRCEDGFEKSSHERSVILVRLINKRLTKLVGRNFNGPTDEQVRRLQSVNFLPVMNRPKSYPFRWGTTNDIKFTSAVDGHRAANKNLVGSVCPLLDEHFLGQDMTEIVCTLLGLRNKAPSVDNVMKQLKTVIHSKHQEDHQGEIVSICRDVYRYLQEYIIVQDPSMAARGIDAYKDHVEYLRHAKFVYIDGTFASCKQIAFKFSGSCSPHLYHIPNALIPYASLLQACGVRNYFEARDYLLVLKTLSDTYTSIPLNVDQIKLASDMIKYAIDSVTTNAVQLDDDEIHDAHQKLKAEAADAGGLEIMAPDQNGVLRAISKLTYRDVWWMENDDDDDGLVLPHASLTLQNARVLGMKTTKEMFMDAFSSSSGFECDFGQSEALTIRLQNILREYNKVSDVMKELLQNADDAKATEIHFIYDPRVHRSERIIDKNKWAKIHELPALCVYNNRPFTERDMKGIQKVGVGGKREDMTTSGRFGIGFNAVYHLTDCPSFITNNEHLCIFDPHTKFVPNAKVNAPGKKFSPISEMEKTFPDMLSGYLRDEFDLEDATMFRFPLRSQLLSKTSQISDKCYDDKQMEELLVEFEGIARQSLYFLKHIKKIQISDISTTTNELRKRYCVESRVSDENAKLRLSEHIHAHKDRAAHGIPPMTQVYTMEITDSKQLNETWAIAQTVGLDSSKLKSSTAITQQGGVKRQLPQGGVAALIRSQPSVSLGNSRQTHAVYSLLPLPIMTSLPVHINGSFILDTSRRYLAKDNKFMTQGVIEDNCLTHSWNILLVEKVIAPSYACLLDKIGKHLITDQATDLPGSLDVYYHLFPSGSYKDWDRLAKSTLVYIGEEKRLAILPVIRKVSQTRAVVTWHQPDSKASQAYFDDLSGGKAYVENIRVLLLKIGFQLSAPAGSSRMAVKLCTAFRRNGVNSECITPIIVSQYLTRNVNRIAPRLPCSVTNSVFNQVQVLRAILEYCLSSTKTTVGLEGVPLKLTNDGTLSLFSSFAPVFVTQYVDLIPSQPQLFIHESLVGVLQRYTDKYGNNLPYGTVIKRFNVEDLDRELRHQLPAEWKGSNRHVEWTPGENGHPNKPWLKRLWEFISTLRDNESARMVNWPILPTTSDTLVLPTRGKTILHLDGTSHSMCSILRDYLKCPIVSSRDYPVSRIVMKDMFSSSTDRDDLLSVFQYMLEERDLKETLNISQARELLLHFQTGYKDKSYIMGSSTLKRLPFYMSHDGTLSSIYGYTHCYTSDSPLLQIDTSWMQNSRCVVLRPDYRLTHLYELLDVRPITDHDLYRRCILPQFGCLTLEAKVRFMQYARDTILPQLTMLNPPKGQWSLDYHMFVNDLRETAFIPDSNGTTRLARSFYNRNTVFQAMIREEDLLPQAFAIHAWDKFLRLLGLQFTVTTDLFLRFAKEIEIQSKCVKSASERDNLVMKSKLLFTELAENRSLRGYQFLKAISTIQFVPPMDISKKHTDLHLEYRHGRDIDMTGSPRFIAIRGAVPASCINVAWTVAKVLPSFATFWGSTTDCDTLGIGKEHLNKFVIGHLKNICGRMVKWNCMETEDRIPSETRKTMVNVMDALLDYLDGNLDDDMKKQLLDQPICAVDGGRVLVPPSQIVFHMEIDDQLKLRPYLYLATEHMKTCRGVLKNLGAMPSITTEQLARVLADIKSVCGLNRMHPNEMAAAYTCVKLLFNGKTTNQTVKADTLLYLPDTKGYLEPSTKLCCAKLSVIRNLPQSAYEMLKFVVSLKKCGIDVVGEETGLFKVLPKHLQPNNIDESLKERLCSTSEDCPAREHCPLMTAIKRMISCAEMQLVMMRLLQRENGGAALTPLEKSNIDKLQAFQNIKCVEKLNVELIDMTGKCLSDRPLRRYALLQSSVGDSHPLLIINHSVQAQDCLIYRQLAHIVTKLCRVTLSADNISILREAISASSPDRMNQLLTEADIPEYDEGTSDDEDPYKPGRAVPNEYHRFLDINPYNRFHDNEIVAYEPPRRLLETASTSCADGGLRQEYLFARIVHEIKISSGSHLTKRYSIDIGQSLNKEVHGTSLYKFCRVKVSAEQASFGPEADQAADLTSNVSHGLLPAATIEEAQTWITDAVEDAFNLREEERREMIRRLMRMWHPDKNQGKELLTTEAFKFLQQEIQRVEESL